MYAGEDALKRDGPVLLGAGLLAGLDRAGAKRLLHDAPGDAGLGEIDADRSGQADLGNS
jgi:hypothetical protein